MAQSCLATHVRGRKRVLKREPMSLRKTTVEVAVVLIVLLVSAAVAAEESAGGTTTTTRPMPMSPLASQAMLDAAGGDTKNWLHPNGSYEQTRYFAGAHINAGNVGRIKPAFVFQTGVLESMQTAPVVVDGVMFLTTSFNHVYAIDAATGEEFWHYRHKPGPVPASCCGNDNRGVAIAGGSLFMGTHDARLVALDARTGKVRWEQQIADPERGLSTTMAPAVVDGKVLIGADGGAHGMRGFVKAFSAADGSLLWTFHTIPDKGHEGVWAESDASGRNLRRDIAAEKRMLAEKGGEFQQTLGGGIATTPAIDRKTRTVFLAVGSPAPAFHGAIRPGDNLYTNSIVAIDLDKGTYKWHFQYIAHDVWNLGAVSPPILTQARDKAGQMIDVVIHGGKTGHVYVHERGTGRLIRVSESMIPQQNLWAPPTIAGARMLPGANGGVEWSPLAVNPKTRLAYAANLHQPMTYHVDETPYPGGRTWPGGASRAIPGEEQWGRLVAVNLDTGKVAWGVKTPQPLIGGVLATAGNLVFNGEANGWFRAFDAISGKELWKYNCGAGVNAPAVSYSVGGRQYVAVAAGGNTQIDAKRGNGVFAFALP
jgi:PQQ-dependent dehydrogenase (methanol/ethanol family)